eukprot:jgi/Orpsp1_1/1180661/evm.model.c7180000074242.1
MKVKSKSLKYIREEGYYVFDKNSHKAIQFNNDKNITETSLIYCDYNGKCQMKTPDVGNYINKSSSPWNVINYSLDTIQSEKINNNICQVEEDQTCHSMNGKELNIGETCMDSNFSALYLFTDGNKCVKAEKTIIFYQKINNKLYQLHNDAIIQLVNGYYFINERNRTVEYQKDYTKEGTQGYMCSYDGLCYPLDETRINYFPDYSSKEDKIFNLIIYDPNKNTKLLSKINERLESNYNEIINTNKNKNKNKKENENENENIDEYIDNSYDIYNDDDDDENEIYNGFEIVTEEGIYKMDDRYYTECEFNDYDELECRIVDEVGSLKTTNGGEIINCQIIGDQENKDEEENQDENDENEYEVECTQATKGGYYNINGILYECNPNDAYDQLECHNMTKEGYFLSYPEETLFE